jgi:SAM-dependent methyltransferase
MTPIEHYAARVAAFEDMRHRWRGGQPGDRWSGGIADQARADPRRQPDANLEALAAYVQRDDVVLDIGGGAGRIGLPLALRCREVITVDPSPGMRSVFEAAANEAGISNVRYVQSPWPAADDNLSADVVLTTRVTYFVADIVPFVRAMERAARRRVIISIWSVPPPVMGARAYELVYGVPMEAPPAHRELLPVLWDMGLLLDVHVLPTPMRQNYVWFPQPTREQMLDRAVQVLEWQGHVDSDRARMLLDEHFDELFVRGRAGYSPDWPEDVRELLITWSKP